MDEAAPLRVARAFAAGDFFVYADGSEARLGVGARERITLRHGQLSVEGPRPRAPVPCRSWEAIAEVFEGVDVAYGYLAFDLAAFEHAYAHAIDVPLHFIVPEVHCVFRPGEPVAVWPEEARARVEEALAGATPPPAEAPLLQLDPEEGRAAYRERLSRALAKVKARDLEKVIVTRTVSRPARLDVLATYERALANQAARRFCFQLGDVRGVGSSPEVVLVARGGEVHTTVLAGTKPRGASAEEDEQLRRDLLADSKETHEHAMSVRLAQEEMRRVATASGTSIRDFMDVKRYPFTQHLSSRVCGRLADGKTIWDAVRAVFPGVTCTGIPKREAIALIGELEGAARGVYGGCVGYYERGGTLDLGIALRSAFEYAGHVTISAGAGIIAESAIDYEVTESVNKMRTIAKHLVERLK
jgi:salicylate synthetase